jgi:hypothetical protein
MAKTVTKKAYGTDAIPVRAGMVHTFLRAILQSILDHLLSKLWFHWYRDIRHTFLLVRYVIIRTEGFTTPVSPGVRYK